MSSWTTDTRPGYRSKTIQHGNVTIRVHRPELTAQERAKVEQQVMDVLAREMRGYLKRCAS